MLPEASVRMPPNVSSAGDGQQRAIVIVGASLALHLALGLLAALAVRPAHVVEDAPPTVAMVFDAAPASPAQAPVPKTDDIPDEQPPAEPPQVAQNTVAEPSPQPPPIESPPIESPASPSAEPALPLLPEPRPAPALPLTPAARVPMPPASIPALAPRPRPAQRAAQKPPAPAVPAASLPSATAAAPASSPAAVNGAWRNALAAWVQSRKHYPAEARRQSTEGQVAVRFTVARDGQVLDAQIVHGSGSDLLDQAALATLRGGRAPPFPADMEQLQLTTTIAIRYHLEQ